MTVSGNGEGMSAWILENYNCYRFVAFDIDDCKGMREEYMLLYFSTHAKTSESLRMLATLLYHRYYRPRSSPQLRRTRSVPALTPVSGVSLRSMTKPGRRHRPPRI